MKIKDKLEFKDKPKPITFLPHESVGSALDMICKENIGPIVVVHPNKKIAGIVTERDILVHIIGEKLDPDSIKLADIMNTDIRVAHEEDNLADWMHSMSHKRFRYLPVVDAEGRLINIMSQGDFIAHTFPNVYLALRQDLKQRLGCYGFRVILVTFALFILGFIALSL